MLPGLAEPESASQRLRLLSWNLIEKVEERAEELEQTGELKLGFGFDPECAGHRHPFGALDGVLEQRRLSDPGLAANDESGAAPPPGPVEQLADDTTLVSASNEHGLNRSHGLSARQGDAWKRPRRMVFQPEL